MMCRAHMNIWDLKSNFRKSLYLTNRKILVIEKVKEEHSVSESDAIEMLIEDKTLYDRVCEVLKEEGFDL